MLRAIKTFIKDPDPVSTIEDVESGLNVVDGIVRVTSPIRSPIRGQQCAAFFYRSFLVINTGQQPTIHKLKEVEVYTDFELEMQGGKLKIVPSKPGQFEQRDHQSLRTRYGNGFQGIEELVMPGARVRVRGKVKGHGDDRFMVMKEVTILQKQVDASGIVGDRKKRKRKKK